MKRAWFRGGDGTYYRNIPLILAEQKRCARWPWRFRRFRELDAEFGEAWRKGLIRKPRLGKGDIEVRRSSFREAYPDRPELWKLDEES